MTLNIANLDRLISHLEGLPEEKFNMRLVETFRPNDCGTACCIHGHAKFLFFEEWVSGNTFGLRDFQYLDLCCPDGWVNEDQVIRRYPLSRAIRTLKHMRSEYLRTGEVVVDWDAPEPVVQKEWTAPKAAERVLPEEIVSLLRVTANSEVSA